MRAVGLRIELPAGLAMAKSIKLRLPGITESLLNLAQILAGWAIFPLKVASLQILVLARNLEIAGERVISGQRTSMQVGVDL